MSEFEFTEKERQSKEYFRSLAKDEEGREVLVGLTYEETIFIMERQRRFVSGNRQHEGRERFLELWEKHQRARYAVLGAEDELERHNPPIH